MTSAAPTAFRHLLHPTDLSPDGDSAFHHALALARRSRAALSIVHTGRNGSLGQEWEDFPKVRDTLARWGQLPADAPHSAVTDLGLEVHKLDLAAREPGHGVTHYALQNDCDLVVLATHARHGVKAWRRPSIAEPLARHLADETDIPALFLPEGAKGFIDPNSGAARLRSILFPIDMSPCPNHAIDVAFSLVHLLDATGVVMHFLHVGAGHPALPFDKLPGLQVEYHFEEGDIAEAVTRVAQTVDADLIVMATQGHDGFLDVLRGSTTERVLHHARCALLAVPAR